MQYDKIKSAFCQAWQDTVRPEHLATIVQNGQSTDTVSTGFAHFIKKVMGLNSYSWFSEYGFDIVEEEIVGSAEVNSLMQSLTLRFWAVCQLAHYDVAEWAGMAGEALIATLENSEAFRDSAARVIDLKAAVMTRDSRDSVSGLMGSPLQYHKTPHKTMRGVFFTSFLIWMFSSSVLEMTESGDKLLDIA